MAQCTLHPPCRFLCPYSMRCSGARHPIVYGLIDVHNVGWRNSLDFVDFRHSATQEINPVYHSVTVKTTRILTKEPMRLTSVRVPRREAELWLVAAGREKISRSEFLRRAINDRAKKILLKD